MVELALQQAFPKAKVTALNAGISGHTTVDGLDRIRTDVLDQQPNLVTVMFGLNDIVRVPIDPAKAAISRGIKDRAWMTSHVTTQRR